MGKRLDKPGRSVWLYGKGASPLHLAAGYNKWEAVKILVEELGFYVNALLQYKVRFDFLLLTNAKMYSLELRIF